MNKKFAALATLLTGAMLGLVSCNKDSSFHATSVVYPYNCILYADQTLDSIVFQTTDSWSLSTPFDWIHIQGKTEGTINNDMSLYIIRNNVTFDENTTDSTRIGHIQLNSHYNAAALYIQFGFINITHPAYTVKHYYGTTNVPTKVSFTVADSANVTRDSICFDAQNRWTLELEDQSSQAWVTASSTRGGSGKHSVLLTMTKNPDTTDRETKAVLTSGEVKNEIVIRQFGKPKKKD